jgi:hypothetical protein
VVEKGVKKMSVLKSRRGLSKLEFYHVDASYKVDSIVGELYTSFDKDRIEAVFGKHEVTDYKERINLLRKCMRVIDTSNNEEDMPVEDEYSDELEIFVDASWRFLI